MRYCTRTGFTDAAHLAWNEPRGIDGLRRARSVKNAYAPDTDGHVTYDDGSTWAGAMQLGDLDRDLAAFNQNSGIRGRSAVLPLDAICRPCSIHRV